MKLNDKTNIKKRIFNKMNLLIITTVRRNHDRLRTEGIPKMNIVCP